MIFLNPQIMFYKTKYLFVFSHMRSRSTVLSHILGDNLDVCGYKELHQSYENHLSLIKMRFNLYNDLKCDFRNKYLFDKILHDDCYISDKLFSKTKPKIIFLLRDPESTIKSIINMGKKTGIKWYKKPSEVADYYCSRLLDLEEFAIKYGKGNFFIDSDNLVNKPEEVLSDLTNWLKLKEPLKRDYTIYKDTGVSGFGDPLPNIKKGVLEKTEGYPDIKIPDDIMIRTQQAYLKCKVVLFEHVII